MDKKTIEEIKQFPKDRSSLLNILLKVQEIEHYLSPESIAEISCFLDISENETYSVASSYHQFRFTPL